CFTWIIRLGDGDVHRCGTVAGCYAICREDRGAGTRPGRDQDGEGYAMRQTMSIGRRCAALLGALTGPLALLALSLWMRVVGSGRVASEARQVRNFDEVALTGSGTLTVTQTGEESLTIQADDNILPLLTSDVVGRRLTLGTKPNTSFSTPSRIVY